MISQLSERARVWLVGVLLLLLVYWMWAEQYGSHQVFVFFERDVLRAQKLLAGQSIFFGPEASGGGHLPGPLFYFLIAWPIQLGFGIAGVWKLACGSLAVGSTVLYFLVQRETRSLLAGVMAAAFFALCPLQDRVMVVLLNSSFTPIWAALGILFFFSAFDSNQNAKHRFMAASALGAVVGFGAQVHFSLTLFLVALGIVQWMARKYSFPRLNKTAWLLVAASLTVPLLPYLLWKNAGQGPPPYTGRSTDSAVALIYLSGIVSEVPWEHWIRTSASRLIYLTPFPILIALAVGLKPGSPQERRYLPLWVALGVGFCSAAYILIAPIGSRYGAVFLISASAISGLAFDWLERKRSSRWYFSSPILSCAGFILVSFIVALWDPHSYMRIFLDRWHMIAGFTGLTIVAWLLNRAPSMASGITALFTLATIFAQNCLHASIPNPAYVVQSRAQLEDLSRIIRSQTGWNFEEARKRVFFLYAHLEQGFEQPYLAIESEPRLEPIDAPPDGFFVVSRLAYRVNGGLRGEDEFRKFLAQQTLPPEIRQGLVDGGIRVWLTRSTEALIVAGYRVVDRSRLPSYFQNTGFPYSLERAQVGLEKLTGTQGVVPLGEADVLFHWNQCPGDPIPPSFCRTAMRVKWSDSQAGKYRFDIQISGFVLSQSSPWVSPKWTEGWIRPYLSVECGREVRRIELASGIGYFKSLVHFRQGMTVSNHSMLAPFVRTIDLDCAGKLKAISAGREGTEVENLRGGFRLNGSSLRYSVDSRH